MDNGVRLEYIDSVKGAGILCIVLLHFEEGIFPGWLNTWIGLFMISTFYVTSGWLQGLRAGTVPLKEFARRRLRQLGMPYLCFSLLIILFEFIWMLTGFMEFRVLLRDIYKTLVLRGIGTLWFFPVLFAGECILCFIRTRRHPIVTAVCAFALTVPAAYCYSHFILAARETDDLHRIMEAPLRPVIYGISAWPVIGIGFLAGRYGSSILADRRRGLICLTGLVFAAFSILFVIHPPFKLFYLNEIISNTVPVFGLICIFFAAKQNLITDFFAYWGRNSLILMCTHYSITEEIIRTFCMRGMHMEKFSGWMTLAAFAAALFVTWLMIPLFNSKLRFMLGK